MYEVGTVLGLLVVPTAVVSAGYGFAALAAKVAGPGSKVGEAQDRRYGRFCHRQYRHDYPPFAVYSDCPKCGVHGIHHLGERSTGHTRSSANMVRTHPRILRTCIDCEETWFEATEGPGDQFRAESLSGRPTYPRTDYVQYGDQTARMTRAMDDVVEYLNWTGARKGKG